MDWTIAQFSLRSRWRVGSSSVQEDCSSSWTLPNSCFNFYIPCAAPLQIHLVLSLRCKNGGTGTDRRRWCRLRTVRMEREYGRWWNRASDSSWRHHLHQGAAPGSQYCWTHKTWTKWRSILGSRSTLVLWWRCWFLQRTMRISHLQLLQNWRNWSWAVAELILCTQHLLGSMCHLPPPSSRITPTRL